jgi:sporulation protein YlmC with PRC-barrel domain
MAAHERRWIMRRFTVAVTMFSVIGLLLTAGAFAQVGTPPPAPPTPAPPVTLQSMTEWHGSQIIGMDVKNQQGEELGEVAELVLDPRDAKIKSVVIASGGVLGIGAKKVAVPWDQVKPASDGQAFVVTMTREELQQAPQWETAAEKASRSTPPATMPPRAPGQ